ncbi:methionyl-tRNA formyltransferase [Candidatus Parcubacteria bacterium]|nr:methionyl-tRNA formyltransferase [Candidatus Parcubacteria bacterium]
MPHKPSIAFFGTPEFALPSLAALAEAGLAPQLIVTAPDRPKGRGLELAPPPVKTWAHEHGIPVLQPEKLDDAFLEKLRQKGWDLFAVVAYGKILPKKLLDIPKDGTLNVHPSLLPKFRGPAPVEGAILEGVEETGVSVMLLDEKMDHGPVVLAEKFPMGDTRDERAPELEAKLSLLGGALLARAIPEYLAGRLTPKAQDDGKATYTKLIQKEEGLIDPAGDPLMNYRKFRAFYGWPGTYFFAERHGKKIRVIVKDAALENGVFKMKRVLPEGGREISYEDFLRGL